MPLSPFPPTTKRVSLYCFWALLMLFSTQGKLKAQTTYTITTPLSFGIFAITKNDTTYDLDISEDNNVTQDSAYVLSLPIPERGEMFLEGLPAETEVTITFDDGTLTRGGGPPTPAFTITDFVTNQPTPLAFETDINGELTFFYGATLRTSGTSQAYQSGNYTGNFNMTISF